jgi:hypothetical protein
MVAMRRVFGDAMISLGAVLVLIMLLVSVDPRVRDQLTGMWGAPGTPAVASVSRQVRDVSTVAFSVARDQSVENAALVIFSLVAAVLLLFMLRT